MRAKIMRLANQLCSLLDSCSDAEFVDEVCDRVASNEPFDEDDINAAEADG